MIKHLCKFIINDELRIQIKGKRTRVKTYDIDNLKYYFELLLLKNQGKLNNHDKNSVENLLSYLDVEQIEGLININALMDEY